MTLFTSVIWFDLHRLIINRYLKTRCWQLSLFSKSISTFQFTCFSSDDFWDFLYMPLFISPEVSSFFFLSFCPPDSSLFLLGPFWSLLNILSLFSMLFSFSWFPCCSLYPSFHLGVFQIRSFLWSRSYISPYLSAGDSVSLLFYSSLCTLVISLFFFAFPLLFKYILYF